MRNRPLSSESSTYLLSERTPHELKPNCAKLDGQQEAKVNKEKKHEYQVDVPHAI